MTIKLHDTRRGKKIVFEPLEEGVSFIGMPVARTINWRTISISSDAAETFVFVDSGSSDGYILKASLRDGIVTIRMRIRDPSGTPPAKRGFG